MPRTKAKKPQARKPARVACGLCYQPTSRRKTHTTETGKLVCDNCWEELTHPKQPDVVDNKKWYVLQVEPGKESNVRKEIIKQSKIHSLEYCVGRIFSPAKLVDKIVPAGERELIHFGEEREARAARIAGENWLLEHLDLPYDYVGPDGGRAVPGYRVSVFPSKGKERDKIGNTWTWKVFKLPPGDQTVQKTMRARKYPGYLICNFEYTDRCQFLLDRAKRKGCWGLLLRPVVLGHKVQVTVGKVSFNWKVRHPETGEIVAKGRDIDKGRAQTAAEVAKAELEAFSPTELDSAEAAELLIRQKAVNQICKDKEEKNRAILPYRVADKVRVVSGAFRGTEGVIVKIDKRDKTDPKVTITIKLWDHEVPVEVKHFEIKRA